tara:strand:- start:839 stop:1096 length:258 start_codon:yes stop_codon:yes gene_type:complete
VVEMKFIQAIRAQEKVEEMFKPKAIGVPLNSKQEIDDHQVKVIREMLSQNKKMAHIAREVGLKPNTIYNFVNRSGLFDRKFKTLR